jgi:thymidylate synthase
MAAELLWIIQGRNDLDSIANYNSKYKNFSDDNETLNGAYGQRIFRWEGLYDVIDETYKDEEDNTHPSFSLEHIVINQLEKSIELLKNDPETRQAVISIYNPVQDTADTKDKPCTNTIQFTIRDNKLNMTVYMRSNDAYLGTPYDVYNFTTLQEIVAGRLNIDVGIYTHFTNSLHLYKEHVKDAKKIIKTAYKSIYTECDIQDARLSEKEIDAEMANVYNAEATTRTMSGLISLEKVEQMLYKIKNLYWRSIAAVIAVYNFKKGNRKEEEINILRNYIGNEFQGLL